MTDPTLLADIDAATDTYRALKSRRGMLALEKQMYVVLLRCRTAIIQHEGTWETFSPPYVDREGDVQVTK
jgi:hypothetical protein